MKWFSILYLKFKRLCITLLVNSYENDLKVLERRLQRIEHKLKTLGGLDYEDTIKN